MNSAGRPVAAAFVVAAFGLGPLAAEGPEGGQILPTSGESIGYFIAEGDPKYGYQPADRELALWALDAWAQQSARSLTVRASIEREALVRVYWAEPSTQLFGEMRSLTVGARRGAAIYVGTDMPALGPDLATRARQDPLWRDAIVYLTCVHELGHALGLPHTRDFRDIMYFFGYGGDIVEYFARYRRRLKSRGDLRAVSPFSDADTQQLRARIRAH